MVYTNENRFFVANAKNILDLHRVEVVLRNEHASSAIGEISPFDAWVELWVTDDADYDRACEIIESSVSPEGAAEWLCAQCGEANNASFEVCWKCQNENV